MGEQVKSPKELGTQGTETPSTEIGEGIQTLSDSKIQSIETLGDVLK